MATPTPANTRGCWAVVAGASWGLFPGVVLGWVASGVACKAGENPNAAGAGPAYCGLVALSGAIAGGFVGLFLGAVAGGFLADRRATRSAGGRGATEDGGERPVPDERSEPEAPPSDRRVY